MIKLDNKRDSMPFPFRWYSTLSSLPDNEFRLVFEAIGKYAQYGEKPNFNNPVLSAFWNEFQARIDFDREKYDSTCQRNQQNIMIRWNKQNTTVYDRIRPYTKNTDADADAEIKKENTKETAEPFSLNSQDPVAPVSFKKWEKQDFLAEIARYPEYASISEPFTDYWTETDEKGKMRFQLERTWEMERRLRRWKNKTWNANNTPATQTPAQKTINDSPDAW